MRSRSIGASAAFAGLVVVAAGASSIAGCFGATEIRVELTTTASCDRGIETQLFVGGPGTTDFGNATSADTRSCGSAEPRIGTLSLVPSGARDAHFNLQVVAGVGVDPSTCKPGHLDGCIVARRRVSFQEHASRRLPVLLSDRCIGVPCGADESCDLGLCAKLADCTNLGCPRERGDVSVDGGPSDAPVDAIADASDAAVVPDAPVVPGTACGPVRDALATGQNVKGQLALQGPDVLYVTQVGGTTELRRVPRRGGAAPTGKTVPDLVAVTANDAELAYAQVTPSTMLATGSLQITRQAAGAPPGGTYGFGSESTEAIGISGAAIVGITNVPAGAGVNPGFYAFALASGRMLGGDQLVGPVPEIGVDEDGEWYGVSGASTVLHFSVAFPGLVDSMPSRTPSSDIAVANQTLYVGLGTTIKGPGIYAIPRAMITANYTGNPLVPNAAPTTMAVFGTDLYYIEGATLYRVSVVGGAPAMPVVLDTVGQLASALAVDADCVYWVQEAGKLIMRRARN